VADLLKLDVPPCEMLFEGMGIPAQGAVLNVGEAKSGKTILAVQKAIAVATGAPLFGRYPVSQQGAALILEQDDPAGAASLKEIVLRSTGAKDFPLYVVPRVAFNYGPQLFEWLEEQIHALALRFVVLDSYTALRSSRGSGIDIVKAEHRDMTLIDELSKRTRCAIELTHHDSKGSAALDWTRKAAGTFAMSSSTEAQIHISRFAELDGAAPERLIRVRGRHSEDAEIVLRFRKETLDFEFVLDGSAATSYPLLNQLKNEFGSETFGPKELSHAVGVSRATANRQIDGLCRAGALRRRGYGEYSVTA
jgi:hypothetical protein